MDHVNPTRMNLIEKKRQAKFALQGVDLLKSKRSVLIKELVSAVPELSGRREKIDKKLYDALFRLVLALGIDGKHEVTSSSLACKQDVSLDIIWKNFWGVKVPEVSKMEVVRESFERAYSLVGTKFKVDEVAQKFEHLVESLIHYAPLITKLRLLNNEVKKTSRRINLLEEHLIPTLRHQISFIQSTLEEREREDIFRLKRMKKKRLEQKSENNRTFKRRTYKSEF